MRDYTFINRMYAYEYPRAAMVTDAVVFRFDGQRLQLLLIERGSNPCKGQWALPGGFMEMEETVEQCCRRELEEETGICSVLREGQMFPYMKQIGTFSDPERDPRGRVVSTAYYALVCDDYVHAGDDAVNAQWFPVSEVLDANLRSAAELGEFSIMGENETKSLRLAFDHAQILRVALQRLREDVHFRPVAFRLMPSEFTIANLQRLYEQILDVKFDRRNFLKKMLQSGIIEDLNRKEECHVHRCGKLYRFNPQQYSIMKREALVKNEF